MINDDYSYQCKSDSITFWAIFISVKGAWLVFGASLSVLTRNIAKEYSESKSIAYAVSFVTSSLFFRIALHQQRYTTTPCY